MRIDLNCDLGEGGPDETLIPLCGRVNAASRVAGLLGLGLIVFLVKLFRASGGWGSGGGGGGGGGSSFSSSSWSSSSSSDSSWEEAAAMFANAVRVASTRAWSGSSARTRAAISPTMVTAGAPSPASCTRCARVPSVARTLRCCGVLAHCTQAAGVCGSRPAAIRSLVICPRCRAAIRKTSVSTPARSA